MTGGKRTNRRGFLKAAGALVAGLSLGGVAFAQQLDPAPACRDNAAPTIRQTEGPFFKPRSPERSELIEPGMTGQPIEITGYVLTRSCKPVARAQIDVWQADAAGNYDNAGFRLRGHQFTDADGRYRLRTVVPGGYVGRARHIHVKVQAPGGRVLTTQIYFPGDGANQRDRLFRKELLIRTAKAAGWLAGRFDFVLDMR
jgi:protocatechuate 3,4-dioxygenase beta subunit